MRYVIIGNGAAGNAAAVAILALDPAGELLIFSVEPEAPYYRPLITDLIAGGAARDIFIQEVPAESEFHRDHRVMGLDSDLKQIILQDGTRTTYDRLLLATGAAAIRPEIPGWPGRGALVLRTLADAQTLAQVAREAKHAIVIGAGRVGLKAALALRQRGLAVTLVEQASHVAPAQFDEVAGEILVQALEAQGIRVIFGQEVTAVTRADGRMQDVTLADGQVLPAELVVAAVGVRPNVELATQAGLAVHQGIIVDRQLRTSAPDIYAAGDVAETTDLVTGHRLVSGLWTNAVEMGRIAGSNMAGAGIEYPGAFGVLNSLEVAGIPTVCLGLTNPPVGREYRVYQSRRGQNYRKLVCRGDILVGALLVGDIEGAGVYAGLIRKKAKIKEMGDNLDQARRCLTTWLSGNLRKVKN